MKIPKTYALVVFVAVGCIAMNFLMVQLSTKKAFRIDLTEVARSLVKNTTKTDNVQREEESDDDKPYFHLKTPFYIYDNELNWANATVDGELYKPPEPQAVGADGKHSDDYWLLHSALNHPMRTLDPEKAKLFFVPTLLNAALQLAAQFWLSQGFFCAHKNHDCFRKDTSYRLFRHVHRSLGKSEYFQRNDGKDHVIVLSHWQSRDLPFRLFNLYKCNSITFENELPVSAFKFPRVRIPTFYVGKRCDPIPIENKTSDFAMIATIKKIPTFKTRSDICKWLQSKDHNGNPYSVSHCGKGQQCPALAEARYGFHVRGDTWGSNRLMDTIMSRTVPLFTSEEQYKILPSFFPWKEISYLVNVTNEESFRASMKDIIDRPESEYLEKQRLLEKYMHILDHQQPYQFDRYMTEFAERLGYQ